MAEDAGNHNHYCVRSGKANGEPDHAPEVVFDSNAKRSDGREVIGADPVQEPGNENGQQKEHWTCLFYQSANNDLVIAVTVAVQAFRTVWPSGRRR